ncbi:hypothetical protein GCM10028777_22830 [Angustibacter speluncae]
MRRAVRGLRGLGAAALVVAVLGGCSLLGGDEPAPTEEGRGGPTAEPEPQGPPPDELWEQVLDAAEAGLEAPAVGTGTGTTASGATHTVEVLGVRRDDTATLVTLRWSADTEDAVGPVEFRDERYDGQNFGRSMALVDDECRASGTCRCSSTTTARRAPARTCRCRWGRSRSWSPRRSPRSPTA